MHRRFGIAIGIVILVLVVWYATPHSLRGSLLSDADIQRNLKARADIDGNGILTAREIRKELMKIIRDVAARKATADINGDGTTDKLDTAATTRGFRALLNAVCGNGVADAGELCDDRNTNSGDGCSATCILEPGFVCSGTPTICRAIVCGDGRVEGTEQCDDGNTTATDGCDAACSVDPGFICQGSPSTCVVRNDQPVAKVTMAPMAQLGTISPGATGRSLVMTFSVQAWNHTPVRLHSVPLSLLAGSYANATEILVFADSAMTVRVGTFATEIGNPENAYLLIDEGSRTIAAGQTNNFYVGAVLQPRSEPLKFRLGLRGQSGAAPDNASYFVATERSTVTGGVRKDGVCSVSTCVVDLVTAQTTDWSIVSVCGDGRVNGGETCDDGDTDSGDGCSPTCSVEQDFTCSGEPSQCSPAVSVCGNGRVQSGEACDDGDTDSGDGCSSACVVEPEYRCTGTTPTVCVSYLDYVKGLADTNGNGTVSDNEALVFLLDIAEAPDKPYAQVSRFDIVFDGVVNDADVAKAIAVFDILLPS